MTFSQRRAWFGRAWSARVLLGVSASVLLAGIASAQALQCSANAANVASLRLNSQAEPVGDLLVTCTGGTPVAVGQIVPGFNFALTSAVPITSRLLAPNWSEALLLVDEPSQGSQLACVASNGVCTVQGTSGTGTYNGSPGHPNIFQAQQSSGNVLSFPGIPLDPPGAGAARIFRFTNIRVNPATLAASAPVSLSVSISGGAVVPINPALATVGSTITPVTVTPKGVQTGANGLAQFAVSFTESYAAAFKTRSTAVAADTSPAPANQSTPNQLLPGVETHFYNSALPFVSGRGNLGISGLADSGTRLMVVFTGVPAGVSLTTTSLISLAPGSGTIRLITTDTNGVGPFQPAQSSTLVPDTNGTITAVFEVLEDDPQTVEHADIPFTVQYSNGASPLNSMTASAGLAPQSKVTTADLSAPLPRFGSLTNFQISSLSISPTTISQGSVGSQYSQQFTATGGSGPYTFSALNVPPGLSLSSSGILNGNPTAAGSYSITVSVADSTQSVASIQVQLTIVNGFVITSATVPNGTVGVPYTTQIGSAGGTGTVTFFVAPPVLTSPSALPPGLFLQSNGTLAGTPLTAGNYTFTITAQDQGGHQASQTFKNSIAPPLVLITGSPLPTAPAGGGQLQVTFEAQGGTPPYTFAIVGSAPPGLTLTPSGILTGNPTAVGTFAFSVSVTDAQKVTVTKPYQITFTAAPALLQVSSSQLNFSALYLGEPPAPQTLVVTSSSVAPVNFDVQLDSGTTGSAVPRWLTVQQAQGVTPSGLIVVVDQSSLVIGIADARILLTIPGDTTRTPIAIGVHLDIAGAAPQLDVSPNLLRLRARAAAPGVQKQVLLVRNTGGSGPTNFSTSVLKSSAWITNVSPSSGQTAFNQPVPVTVTFNSQGLKPGTYRDVIRFASSLNTVDVPVSLYVADSGPFMGLDTRGLRFQERQGAGSSYTQTVRILNYGDPGSTVNWAASLVTGSDWLALSTTRGTSTPSQPGGLVLSPGPNAANLGVGPHYAVVQITDLFSIGSPEYIVAVLDVAAATTPALPELSTGYLYFVATQGAASPIGGSVRVFASSVTPANFQAAASTTDGANWLQASPATSAASTGSPGLVTVVVNPSNLNVGVYKGQVSVAMNGALRAKDVTLVVLGTGAVSQTGNAQPSAGAQVQNPSEASCVPSRLAMTLGNLTTSFDVPAQFPAMLSVQLTDNCNSPVTNASVVATFSNGDPPLTLSGDGTSDIYTETWQPGTAQANMAVTLRANVDPYAEASLLLTGNVEDNVAPVLNRGGTVNNLNIQLDAPLAPGTVISLYGSDLSSQTVSPGVLPLLTAVNGSFVLAGGEQLPLYYVSGGQINAQLPVDLPLNRPQSVIVSNAGAYTLPDTINLTAVSPGVAALASGAIIAQHADFSLVDEGHPAKPGEVLICYLVGMGATNPSTPTGQQTTGPLQPAVVQPTVTVDSQPATVSFAGLTPGGIGLYQINFQVPVGARSGSLPVVITQGDAGANATTLVVAP